MFYNSYNNQKDKNSWKSLAEIGHGVYKEFDFNQTAIQFEKKYDKEWISDLGDMINDTYLTYGEFGKDRLELSLKLDSISETLGEECLESRMIYKASRFYQNRNASWDLIDLFSTDQINFDDMDKEVLSPVMKSMKKKDFFEYLQIKKLERKELLAEMATHAARRDLYLYKKHAKLKLFNKQSYFYQALISSLELGFGNNFKITF